MRRKDEPVHAVDEPPDEPAQGTTRPTSNRTLVDGFAGLLFSVGGTLLFASR